MLDLYWSYNRFRITFANSVVDHGSRPQDSESSSRKVFSFTADEVDDTDITANVLVLEVEL